jgi:hypothetical protein
VLTSSVTIVSYMESRTFRAMAHYVRPLFAANVCVLPVSTVRCDELRSETLIGCENKRDRGKTAHMSVGLACEIGLFGADVAPFTVARC